MEDKELELSDPRVAEAIKAENTGFWTKRRFAIVDRWWDSLMRKAGLEEKDNDKKN